MFYYLIEYHQKLKEPLLRLIRSIAVSPDHADANGDTEFTVLEVHNSYHQYVERYLQELAPNVRGRRIIPCDAVLRKAYKMSINAIPVSYEYHTGINIGINNDICIIGIIPISYRYLHRYRYMNEPV